MKTTSLGSSGLLGSRLAYGCWRIAGTWHPSEITNERRAQGRAAVRAAYEAGYTVFDHADIYCDGEAETLFGEVLREISGMRSHILVVTKCGIRKPGEPKADSPYRYDFSADYIVRCCEGSLKRLGLETVDVFLLHRPDYLMDPAEVAGAFVLLKDAGKVREFGVSNFRPAQLAALQKACPMPLMANQIEISLANVTALEDGSLDDCLARGVTPMAWSPLGAGKLGSGAKNLLPSQEKYRTEEVLVVMDRIAAARGTGRIEVALAWLLRHPARIMPVVGSVNPENIRAAARADTLDLTREEWYQLFRAARGQALP
jgi:predicted oxidoreductase